MSAGATYADGPSTTQGACECCSRPRWWTHPLYDDSKRPKQKTFVSCKLYPSVLRSQADS